MAINSKQIKKLRKLIKPLQVEWLQSILPEDQGKEITVSNVKELMPDQSVSTYKELQKINEQQQERNFDGRI